MVWQRVNLSIFRLTGRERAEMVRLLFMPAMRDGRSMPARAAKTARSKKGGTMLAIAPEHELRPRASDA
jgi:hypothetical protein